MSARMFGPLRMEELCRAIGVDGQCTGSRFTLYSKDRTRARDYDPFDQYSWEDLVERLTGACYSFLLSSRDCDPGRDLALEFIGG